MGIHNSSILSSERRVVNPRNFKINMKAFMTACAFLASSAKADPQVIANEVNLDHTISHPGLVRPYNVVPVSYTNIFGNNLNQPLLHHRMPMYQVATLPTQHFIKRDAKLETPYFIKTKMDNPIDGSEHEVQIKVYGSGKGQSFQHVEQNDPQGLMQHNYIMEHRRMAQRPIISKMYLAAPKGMDMGMNQMRIERLQMGVDRNQMYRGINSVEQNKLLGEIADRMMAQQRLEAAFAQMHEQGNARQMDNSQEVVMNRQQQTQMQKLKLQQQKNDMLADNLADILQGAERQGNQEGNTKKGGTMIQMNPME